ncbi:phosphate ABC transporter substrate-binding protein PstS [Micromonospora sp. MS34]|uniref:phosphate ABC transporter substrate-binding protein PstS n=1 Tax=Micromonospora sp. MS34 TaxID=3385971 RepID=UPI00399F6432
MLGCTTEPREGPAPGLPCGRGTLNARGSSAQANAMMFWIERFQEACPGSTVNYEPSGSGAGISAFIGGSVNLAGADSPLSPEELEQARPQCSGRPPLVLPMVAGPVTLAYHLPGAPRLRLTPETVAAIFTRTVRRWDDPAIRAENPGVALPPTPIRTVHRTDSSGTTKAFTAYLTEVAGGRWPYGSDRTWAAPDGLGVAGSRRVLETVQRTAGAIGYLELSYLRGTDLPVAAVRNAAGEFVPPSGDAAGESLGTPGPDLRLPIDRTSRQPGAYPLALVTYEAVCDRGLAADKAPLVRAFLSWTSSEAGQRGLVERGYTPLPEPLRQQVRTAVERIS